MPQTYQRRQEIIEEQRRADNDNTRFRRPIFMSQDAQEQVQADNDDEGLDGLAEQEAQAALEEEQERETQERVGILQRLRRHQQEVQEAEVKAQELKDDRPGYFRYSPVFIVAGFKDLLDVAFIGSLPVIGTIITFCFGILIFLLLFLVKKNKALMDMKIVVRWAVVLICGSVVEGFIFGINFLPIELITVFIIFYIDRHFSNEQIQKALERVDSIKSVRG